MVKRREPASAKRQPTTEEIEAFASGAESNFTIAKPVEKPVLDPHAKHDFRAIRVPFNEYEFEKLEEAAAKMGRSKLNFIRWAILKMAEDIQ